MEEAGEAILFGDPAQGGHDHVLVVGGDVGVLVDRSEFVLAGGHFVVAGLHGDAQLEEFAFGVEHAGQDALGDGAEVLVFELLALGGFGAEERAAADGEVRAREVEVAVDEEVFLFRSGGGEDVAGIGVAEDLQHALGLAVEGLHGA